MKNSAKSASNNKTTENKSSLRERIRESATSAMSRFKQLSHRKRVAFAVLTLMVVLASAALLGRGIMASSPRTSTRSAPTVIPKSDLNKEFTFPVKNSRGEEITKISYLIESAELRSEIIIRGQRATAVPGRKFLILNLKLRNDSPSTTLVNTRDFLRISENEEKDWLAADIHNDPVEVQAISTKLTRLGFSVSEGARNFKTRVGEINGEKTVFDINFDGGS